LALFKCPLTSNTLCKTIFFTIRYISVTSIIQCLYNYKYNQFNVYKLNKKIKIQFDCNTCSAIIQRKYFLLYIQIENQRKILSYYKKWQKINVKLIFYIAWWCVMIRNIEISIKANYYFVEPLFKYLSSSKQYLAVSL
jgi:hypothetical protein